MNLYWSTQQHSYGCRFLRCKGQPQCKAFDWVDQPQFKNEENEASSSNTGSSNANANANSNVKVTVEENGKKVTYEGQVNDVIELMNQKLKL